MVDSVDVISYFQYVPSLPANIIALVAFFLVTCLLAWQTWRSVDGRMMWIIVLTGGIEVGGYISHLVARQTAGPNDAGLNAYIANLVLIILAPNFAQLLNYLVAGKAARVAGVAGKWLNARNISVFFFVIDIITIAVQGAGSALIASQLESDGTASQAGENIVLVGLAIQLFFFAVFVLLTGYVWHLTHSKAASARIPTPIFVALWATCALISLRNCYRITEIAIGWNRSPNTNETFFYCLDFLPIFLAFLVYSALFFPTWFAKVQAAPALPDVEAGALPADKSAVQAQTAALELGARA